ncbi:META domain-containing protein [Croceicoccus ponticola]|uniref:META domain-containing protein n=1 Tax=Croceicoccus ponticola TaxID=2217664 RepID=A0A437H1K4_9SPHN|nr:META domain-containing protein [Croceicoccus ponticola]RVQ69524.1 META domain-containing protein [Croceicoccus ponticola]
MFPWSVRPNLLALGACFALAGCDAPPAAKADADPVAASPTPAPAPSASNFPGARTEGTKQLDYGFAPITFDMAMTSWLVVRIDGKPMNEMWDDPVTVQFGTSTLSWNGCNAHRGLYVQRGGTFATGPLTATTTRCAPMPDGVIASVLAGQPMIAQNAEGKIMLATAAHRLTLSQIDGSPRESAAPAIDRAPFRLLTEDGGARPPILSFEKGTFAVWVDCPGAITGKVSVSQGRMKTAHVAMRACDTHRPTATNALKEFFAASPAISRGPDGELLLSDGDTVIGGNQCYTDTKPCAHAVAK